MNDEIPIETVDQDSVPLNDSDVSDKPIDTKEDKDVPEETGNVSITVPNEFFAKLAVNIAKITDGDTTDLSESTKATLTNVIKGLNIILDGDSLSDTIKRPGTEWGTGIASDDKELTISAPTMQNMTNKLLTGESAVLYSMSKLGMGTIMQVPLWHSGLWVSLVSPSEVDILNVYIKVGNDKISIGRETSGLIYSNVGVIVVKIITELVTQILYNNTVEGGDEINILDVAKIQDLYPLIWGVVCAMFPIGFDYEQPCSSNIGTCTYKATGKIDPKKLLWVDKKALSADHIAHMAKKTPNSVSLDDINRYQSTLQNITNKTIAFTSSTGAELKVTLRSPSISEHIENGDAWIASLTTMVESMVSTDIIDDVDKNTYISKHANITKMREYSHFVKSLEIDTNIITDRSTINKILDMLSNDSKIRVAFIDGVRKFVDDSTIAVVGIPSYDCPECGVDQNKNPPNANFNNIIPLDTIVGFFILSDQKNQ